MMMQWFKTKQDWLAARAGYITSTDVSALFGLSPYKTALEVYIEKRTDSNDADGFTVGERMQWGLDLEHVIANRAAERHGLTNVQPVGWRLYADDDHRIAASIDFTADDADGGPVVIECKNVDGLMFRDGWQADDEELISAPAHIELQVQTQLRCTGVTRILVAALVGGNRLVTGWRAQIPAVQKQITERVNEFWARETPPDPVYPDDAEAVCKLFAYAAPGKLLEAQGDADLAALVREHKRISGEIKDLEGIRDTLKAQILQRIDDAERVLGDGYTISAGIVDPVEPTVITADMVGQTYGGRRGFRNLRITMKKAKP